MRPRKFSYKRGVKREGFVLFMHRLLLSVARGRVVDHLDGNGLNNQKVNLRQVSTRQNQMNRRPNQAGRPRSSRYKGVSRTGKCTTWQAKIVVEGKRVPLGRFKREVDAARAYNKAAVEYFGEYARLNDIPGPKPRGYT
jgi:hypothetical protein